MGRFGRMGGHEGAGGWCQGVEVLDIVMVKRHGRFSGEAYVVLPGVPPLDFALQKNRSYMGKRYVEVFKAKKMVRSGPSLAICNSPLSAVLSCCVISHVGFQPNWVMSCWVSMHIESVWSA